MGCPLERLVLFSPRNTFALRAFARVHQVIQAESVTEPLPGWFAPLAFAVHSPLILAFEGSAVLQCIRRVPLELIAVTVLERDARHEYAVRKYPC